MVKKKEEPAKAKYCKICKHENREGIEMIAIISSLGSWNIARERINNTFGTNFTVESIKKHMMEHELHSSAVQQGVILSSLREEEGAPAKISIETMLQTMLIQGMLDLAKGKIRCKTPAELMSVANMLMNIQRRREQELAIENGDIQGFYNAMAAYGEAMRSTLTQNQMQEIMYKANALGACFNINNARLEPPVDDFNPQQVMSQAVKDYARLGRPRERDELIEAGIIEVIDQDIELP